MNIIGRLTWDAEVRKVAEDRQIVNFSLAINDCYKNRQGERVEQTTFFDCAYWISTKVAKLLTKGTLVELTGRVYAMAWQGSDGEAHARLNFHTSEIKLHGGGRRSAENGNSTDANTDAKKSTNASSAANPTSSADISVEQGDDDDLPF
ncbi:single-stranded DNA-binding protein [Chryseobacterium sp. SSA4.19]|uniref:single-stranded DNA-binding protein n=1 Tax=Chryseobacterium sp. SSA4.19 TaxID=2919915 RepID=UPI001F4E30CC|nr:single-stranded DNA-binding protein [Chryseobacterium sp. SSA4.19]MCJ8155724.1 single-stranded DNA-binding protein [Chryseobacterium sp. SSA4.19]